MTQRGAARHGCPQASSGEQASAMDARKLRVRSNTTSSTSASSMGARLLLATCLLSLGLLERRIVFSCAAGGRDGGGVAIAWNEASLIYCTQCKMENECFLPLEIGLGSMSSGSGERGRSGTVATPTAPATVSRKRGGALGVCFQSYSLSSLLSLMHT
jgi:hypothetical protein